MSVRPDRLTSGLDPWVAESPERASTQPTSTNVPTSAKLIRSSALSPWSKKRPQTVPVLDMNIASDRSISRSARSLAHNERSPISTRPHTHKEPTTVVWPHAFVDAKALSEIEEPYSPPTPDGRTPISFRIGTASSFSETRKPTSRPTSSSARTLRRLPNPTSSKPKYVLKPRLSSAFRRIPSARSRSRPQTVSLKSVHLSTTFRGSCPRRISTTLTAKELLKKADSAVSLGKGISEQNLKYVMTAEN
ncbi:hypothetical protein HK097_007381, partial [Rhizophlyctis rosea]